MIEASRTSLSLVSLTLFSGALAACAGVGSAGGAAGSGSDVASVQVHGAGGASPGGGTGAGGMPGGNRAPFSATPDGDALEVRLQVNGNGSPCGSCEILLAQARGGTQPFSYAWSDPSLVGPGPHTVCPTTTTTYSVKVTDSSAVMSPEFNSPAQIADASEVIRCVEAPADAETGREAVEPMTGCVVEGMQSDPERTDHVSCPMGDLTGASWPLDRPLTPGQPFTYHYDQFLPIALGAVGTVDVYGAMSACGTDEKLFTIQLDTSWEQGHCFTPHGAYKYNTTVTQVNGFYLPLGVTASLCTGCAPTAP